MKNLYLFAAELIMKFGKDVDCGAFEDERAVAQRVVFIATGIVDEVLNVSSSQRDKGAE